MPKYQITIESTVKHTYIIEVEDENLADAKEQAIQVLHAGDADPVKFAVIDDNITHVGMVA